MMGALGKIAARVVVCFATTGVVGPTVFLGVQGVLSSNEPPQTPDSIEITGAAYSRSEGPQILAPLFFAIGACGISSYYMMKACFGDDPWRILPEKPLGKQSDQDDGRIEFLRRFGPSIKPPQSKIQPKHPDENTKKKAP